MGKQTALIIIDVQQGFDDAFWGTRNNPDAEKNIKSLLDKWRADNQPVIHIQHCSVEEQSPLHPSKPGVAFKPEVLPQEGEIVFQKNVNSSFIGTNLEAHLREQGIEDLVIVGLTTDHCVSTTTRMAGNFGFNVRLVADATATFDRPSFDGSRVISANEIYEIHLSSVHDEFCQVCTTADILNA